MYKILKTYPYLKPFENDINLRMDLYNKKLKQLLKDKESLKDFANAHKYFGIHKLENSWVYREWAPNAQCVYITGDFNCWNFESHPLSKKDNGVWEIYLPLETLKYGSRVKTIVKANGVLTEHISPFATRVVQNEQTKMWHCEVVDDTEQYQWTDQNFRPDPKILIYETHVGMSSEELKVNNYVDFANNILPKIKEAGYTTIQIMAIMEHPYYGSFGYQVSSFYAASSRYGWPNELKYLVNKAHNMGIRVLLDLVHSHAVKNTLEGLNMFDGTEYQFFHKGPKGEHPAWGTKLFNYGKPEVLHYLLSNLKYWLEEYHFDGFRFDGVTSMLYNDHGLGSSFSKLDMYFSMNTDTESITYLQLANQLIREVKRDAITIAEDMSGMPGMTDPVKDGGIGFDYRLAMGQPDMWIRLVKTTSDENWNMSDIYYQLTNRNCPTVAYVESHDQALVGDQTMMFRLCGKEIYTAMDVNSKSLVIERAIALHKMIRLVTIAAGGTAYLNFMGNEFGHPEWIDFPREGNNWSYEHARRQWSLLYNENLRFRFLGLFDKDMIKMVKDANLFSEELPSLKLVHNDNHILAFERKGLLFVFNFHPSKSFDNFVIPVSKGEDYEVILSTDDEKYNGMGRIAHMRHSAFVPGKKENSIKLYIPSRTAMVLKPVK